MAKRGKDALKSKTPSLAFGTHEETDAESNSGEKIQSIWWKRHQPSPKEDMPSKDSSGSSSEEEQPTNEALRDKAQQRARQLDTNFDAWQHKKIAKGITGWTTRDTMICDLPKHRKVQPNHPDPVGLPLDYMGECQVFDSIRSDVYDLCQFYILGMTGDPPEFPTPLEPATRRQIRDLLKLAHAIGLPYMILVHSADSVTAISMLRELHTATCLRCLQVHLRGKSVKLSSCPFYAYAGGGENNLSYLNHIIIAHYNASYGCRKCLKQAFVSSSPCTTTRKCASGLPPGSLPEARMASLAVAEVIAAMEALPRPHQKRMARLPLLIPRDPVPLLLPNHHHAIVDKRPPTTTSPTRRTWAGRKRR